MSEENKKIDLAQEVAIQIDALTTENSELKEKLRATEIELMKKNDVIKIKDNQITELKCVCENQKNRIDAYRKELEAKSEYKDLVKCHVDITSCEDFTDSEVSLESVLTAAKDAGCVLVTFGLAPEFGGCEE